MSREIHQNAIDFLRAQEHTGLLDHFGGAQGAIDCADAAHFLTRLFVDLEIIFTLARKPDPEPVFYICAGANFCEGSGVYSEPRNCPNCRAGCVAVDRRGERIEAP